MDRFNGVNSRGHERPRVIDLPMAKAVLLAGILAAIPLLVAPLGRLASPFALLVVLPPLALSLEAFGWATRLARRLAHIRTPVGRLLATYVVSISTSATLTLDVAAVTAPCVGIEVAGDQPVERRWQLNAAILGANVGSLLLPFSNLTNLVLVSASGISFVDYVGLSVGPQIAIAVALSALLVIRAGRALRAETVPHEVGRRDPIATETPIAHPASSIVGAVACAGALLAVAAGLTGLDMAIPFAVSAGLAAGIAISAGRLRPRTVLESIPASGLAVVLGAAVLSALIDTAAVSIPQPDQHLTGLMFALCVGGLLSLVANNLPAAAFGAIWLAHAHPTAILAFLIGTNVLAVATPHGSVATLLGRSVGARLGVVTCLGSYLSSAWPYAVVGGLAGLAALYTQAGVG